MITQVWQLAQCLNIVGAYQILANAVVFHTCFSYGIRKGPGLSYTEILAKIPLFRMIQGTWQWKDGTNLNLGVGFEVPEEKTRDEIFLSRAH